LEVELAALPRNAAENRQTGCFQAQLVVTSDELHAEQTASYQAFQERSPVNFLLADRDCRSQNAPFARQLIPLAIKMAAFRICPSWRTLS
jgi:hypothetical protein